MPLKRSSSGLVGASLIVINIDPDKHFIRTVGSFVDADSRSVYRNEQQIRTHWINGTYLCLLFFFLNCRKVFKIYI